MAEKKGLVELLSESKNCMNKMQACRKMSNIFKIVCWRSGLWGGVFQVPSLYMGVSGSLILLSLFTRKTMLFLSFLTI